MEKELTAEEYFNQEYDGTHIPTVVDSFDPISLYGLMDEYASYREKSYHRQRVESVTEEKINPEIDLQLQGLRAFVISSQMEMSDRVCKEIVRVIDRLEQLIK